MPHTFSNDSFLPEGTGKGKEFLSLEQFKNLGFDKLYDGYVDDITGLPSPLDDMTSAIHRTTRDTNQDDVDKINSFLDKYQINTKERVSAFFAEVSAETGNGKKFIEGAGTAEKPVERPINRTNLNKWFDDNKKYGAKYRGGGAIQLTWDHHYIGFEEWMKTEFGIQDSNITGLGAEYVALNYTWEAAAYFWDKSNLNAQADTGNIHNVTYVVNSEMTDAEYKLRKIAYDKWMKEYVLPSN